MHTSNQIVCLKITRAISPFVKLNRSITLNLNYRGQMRVILTQSARVFLHVAQIEKVSLFNSFENQQKQSLKTNGHQHASSIHTRCGLVWFSVLIYFNQTVPTSFSLKAKPPTRGWDSLGSHRKQARSKPGPDSFLIRFFFFWEVFLFL